MNAQTTQNIANTALAATTANGFMAWVTENATAITAISSVIGVIATCIFYAVSAHLRKKELELKRQELRRSYLKEPSDDPDDPDKTSQELHLAKRQTTQSHKSKP